MSGRGDEEAGVVGVDDAHAPRSGPVQGVDERAHLAWDVWNGVGQVAREAAKLLARVAPGGLGEGLE